MRIYLDNCCFNRPFDDQTLVQIRLETEAILEILERIKLGRFSLAWSYILDFENAANPFPERRTEIQRWKSIADSCAIETPEILSKMRELTAIGLKPLDTLHVASAITLNCDYFLTVDKGVLKKAPNILKIKITNPVNFLIEEQQGDENRL